MSFAEAGEMCENAITKLMPTPPRKSFNSPRSNDPRKSQAQRPFAGKRVPEKPVVKRKVQMPKPPRTVRASFTKPEATESWDSVASWYEKHLTDENTYHNKVILPNLIRLVAPKRGESIVDLASGTGFFSAAFAKEGAQVTGIDVSEELIAIARKHSPAVSFHVGSAEKFDIVETTSKDKVVIVLAIQNIEQVAKVFAEASRVLKSSGTFHIVMNHPAFRIPKQTSWEFDEKKKVQYRRVDEYLSESKSAIAMHPGQYNSPETLSFHRPLQFYFKLLQKAGLVVERLEEWTSHKESDSGPRAKAENIARKEFPLFLYLGAKKL